MILPTKYVTHDRALLTVGGEILECLEEPKSVSALWEHVRQSRRTSYRAPIPFDWFILALNLLYAISAIDYAQGLVHARLEKTR